MWLVVADRHEVLEDAVADVGPALDYFIRRRPIPQSELCSCRGYGGRATDP